jgi:hypothetical protein
MRRKLPSYLVLKIAVEAKERGKRLLFCSVIIPLSFVEEAGQ